MERKITLEYNWYRDDAEDVKPEHIEALEESADSRIREMMAEGYTSGELLDDVRMSDADGEDGISYSGWWSCSMEVISND